MEENNKNYASDIGNDIGKYQTQNIETTEQNVYKKQYISIEENVSNEQKNLEIVSKSNIIIKLFKETPPQRQWYVVIIAVALAIIISFAMKGVGNYLYNKKISKQAENTGKIQYNVNPESTEVLEIAEVETTEDRKTSEIVEEETQEIDKQDETETEKSPEEIIEIPLLSTDTTDISMQIGDTINLLVFYEDGQSVSNLTWSSDRTAIATVNDGKVEAVGKGTAVITVTDENGTKLEYNISVQEIEVESIELDKSRTSVKVNKSVQLKANIYPEDASNQEVEWLSDDDNIAIVDSTGLVTGKKAGTVNIICRSTNGKEASCTVTVKKVKKSSTADSSQNNGAYQPFYGIWCGAAKTQSGAERTADSVRDNGFEAEIFISSDWSNLNQEKWYVITAGVYYSKSDAENALSSIQNVYPTAYIKYSGEWKG